MTQRAGTTGDAFAETVERAVLYVQAGADCAFVAGVVEQDTIRGLVAAIPGPLNVLARLANIIDALTLFSLGVKRVSLARAALNMVDRAGREPLDSGTLGFLDGAMWYADPQRRFGSSSPSSAPPARPAGPLNLKAASRDVGAGPIAAK